jgi:hypothetical protein
VRWTNFETRVQSVPDSPQRGFELALYYAVTGDEVRGREAWQWALAHPCERRQVALVFDWAGELAPAEAKQRLGRSSCPSGSASPQQALRDGLFMDVALDRVKGVGESVKQGIIEPIENGGGTDPVNLYAVCEFLIAVRTNLHLDLREEAPEAFMNLPAELLLSLKPAQVERPSDATHIAALALVAVDPNLPGAQFLQGWVMEDRQTITEGPGVAYELLWADPYLPGIGYQNLDPWVYQPAGRLFARADWSSDACWISISQAGMQQDHCPPGLDHAAAQFGRLSLIPASEGCTDIPAHKNTESVILWDLEPHETIEYMEGKVKRAARADPAGMWLAGENATVKACRARAGRR